MLKRDIRGPVPVEDGTHIATWDGNTLTIDGISFAVDRKNPNRKSIQVSVMVQNGYVLSDTIRWSYDITL